METWKEVTGYNGEYFVSNHGRVKSFKYSNPRILKQRKNSNGRLYLNLAKNGLYKSVLIHRLVALHFVNGDTSLSVDHLNGDKTDNRAENLEWVTNEENRNRAVKNNLVKYVGEENGRAKLKTDEVIRIRQMANEKIPFRKIANLFSVSHTNVSDIVNKKKWKHID